MSFVVALIAAALSGFIALSYEIVWYRAYAFVSQGAPGVFGLLLGSYLTGVALGSLGSRWFCPEDRSAGEPRQLRPVAGFVFLANLASFVVVPLVATLATHGMWERSFVLVAVAAGLMGATLPLVAHFGIAADDRAGSRLSYVYLANIIGSASGSLLTGFVLLDVMSLRPLATLLAALGTLLFLGLFVSAYRGARGIVIGVAISAATIGGIVAMSRPLFHHVYEKLLFRKRYTADKELETLVENRHGVIAVHDGMVYGGGAYDGIFNIGLRHDPNWVFRAYAIGAVHPRPREVLMVGLASGSWSKIVSGLPGVEHVTIVEINPGYLELIAQRSEVASLLTDPRVEIVIDDGRRWLARHPDRRFDVVVMNTTWHWRDHATNLLSEEFFHAVRAHLREGGVFHFNTTMSYDVMKTAFTVFPHGMRMYNFVTASDSPLVFDRDRWRQILTTYRLDGELLLDPKDDFDRERLTKLLGLPDTMDKPPTEEAFERREDLLARIPNAQVVTDDNMRCEWWSTSVPED